MEETKHKRLYYVYFKFYLHEILEKENYNDNIDQWLSKAGVAGREFVANAH